MLAIRPFLLDAARMTLVDSHCHLDDDAFDADRDAVLMRARAAGVGDIVVPAYTARHFGRLRAFAAIREGIHPAYGIHPLYVDGHGDADLAGLPHWVEGGAVAVGECGLDAVDGAPDAGRQRRFFSAQLALARKLGLPVVIHARRTVEEVIQTLRRFPGIGGVVHSFSGSEVQARRLLDMGFLLGFGGPLTYPGAHRLRRLVRVLPLNGLLLETDAPDQAGVRHRGARNEPAWLPEILAELAALRAEVPDVVAHATAANARRLFALETA